jgi:hypothetical protein
MERDAGNSENDKSIGELSRDEVKAQREAKKAAKAARKGKLPTKEDEGTVVTNKKSVPDVPVVPPSAVAISKEPQPTVETGCLEIHSTTVN